MFTPVTQTEEGVSFHTSIGQDGIIVTMVRPASQAQRRWKAIDSEILDAFKEVEAYAAASTSSRQTKATELVRQLVVLRWEVVRDLANGRHHVVMGRVQVLHWLEVARGTRANTLVITVITMAMRIVVPQMVTMALQVSPPKE